MKNILIRYITLWLAAWGMCLTTNAQTALLERIQQELFTPSCGIPACHDGSFEPDFRTPESSFYTLVYHPVVKNNVRNQFTYRVVPGKPEESVLLERITNCCFVNENDRMPFTVGDTLNAQQIALVKTWIAGGAPNVNGEKLTAPIKSLHFHQDYFVLANDSLNMSTDEFRLDKRYPKPLIIQPSVKKIKFMFVIDDAENQPQEYFCGFYKDQEFKQLIVKAPLQKETKVYSVNFDRAQLPSGTQVYMQLEAKRNEHVFLYPNQNTPLYQKIHWSYLPSN